MKEKIIILSTDTPHHRYFINKLEKNNFHISNYIFETESVKPSFNIKTSIDRLQNKFEKREFFSREIKYELTKEKISKVKNINEKNSINLIKKFLPAKGIVFGTRKISENVIRLFKGNIYNVHRGITQRYRGLDSEYWSIYHSDYESIGVTIHKVSKILDQGKILNQKRLKLKKNFKIHQLRFYTTVLAANLMIDVLDKKIKKKYSQPNGRYYSFMPKNIKEKMIKKFNSHTKYI